MTDKIKIDPSKKYNSSDRKEEVKLEPIKNVLVTDKIKIDDK